MILDLTKENLQKNGFSEIEAENILNQKNESIYYQDNSCIISSAENKIYTEIDFYRKEYLSKNNPQFPYNCPDLVNEYFDLALTAFLQKTKTVLGILFNKTDQTKKFISNEIEKTKERIKGQKEFLEKMKLFTFESKKNDIQICEAYIDLLENKSISKVKEKGITVKHKALKMYYEGKIVTKKEHGTSLYNKFIHYSNKQNRIANPDGTDLVLRNKIKLFKKVIETLNDKYKHKAQDEVKILETYLVAK